MPHDNLNSSRQTKLPFRLKAFGAVVMSALIMSSASAAGLGRLTVLSSLGQPLNAEIELTSVSIEELGSLTVRLASAEAFRQANIELNPALLALRFAVEQRNGRQVVHVSSSQPINDPFVDMLLEVGGASGKLVREYTFLLDPAELRRPQAPMLAPGGSAPAATPVRTPQVAASGNAPASSNSPAATATPGGSPSNAARRSAGAPRPATATAAAPVPAAKATLASGDTHKVKSGETLAGIAGQFKQDGISLDQMLVAMQRANPNAFNGGNINRLRSGQVLRVPDRAAASSIEAPEARSIVIAQLADFNGYKARLAAQVAGKPNRTAEASPQAASGKVTARIEETPTPASEARDKLKLSKSGTSAADKAATAGMSAEERIAANKALADANARVAALEKNVGELQALLELKNKDMAERQNQAAAAKTAASAPAAQQPASITATPVAPEASAAASAAGTVTPAAEVAASTPAAADVVATPVPAVVPAAPVAARTENAAPAPVPAPAPEPTLINRLTDNPLLLGLIALVVAAGGAVGLRRLGAGRKKGLDGDEGNTLGDSTALKANSIFAATGGQSVDTNNSVFNSNFAPSATQLDTNEVDPVAEADVYIAYGRDVQAEEILKEALRTQPERNAVRLKLLEIYASRPDLRAFESAATELYSRTSGEGDDWHQAAVLGYGIDPTNPMYASGRTEVPELSTDGADDLDMDALLNVTHTNSQADAEAAAADIPMLGDDVADSKSGGKDKSADQSPSLPLATLDMPAGVSDASYKTPAVDADHSKSLADHSMDFDLGRLGRSDTPAATDVPELLNADAKFDVNDLDFEIADPKKPAGDSKSKGKGKKDKAAVSNFDIPEIDDVLSKPESASASSKDFDLSNIDLSLDANAAAAVGADADGTANTAEMATKLDLALAYQEIGDEDGARELLAEVVKGGSSDQAGRAKTLLEKLS